MKDDIEKVRVETLEMYRVMWSTSRIRMLSEEIRNTIISVLFSFVFVLLYFFLPYLWRLCRYISKKIIVGAAHN